MRREKDGDSLSISTMRRRREGDGSSISRVALKHLSTNMSSGRDISITAAGSRSRDGGSRQRDGGSRQRDGNSRRIGGNNLMGLSSTLDPHSFSRFRDPNPVSQFEEDYNSISNPKNSDALGAVSLGAIVEEKSVLSPITPIAGGYFPIPVVSKLETKQNEVHRLVMPTPKAPPILDPVLIPAVVSKAPLPLLSTSHSTSDSAAKPKSTFKKRMPSLAISTQAEDNYENVSDDMMGFMKNQSTVIQQVSPHSVSEHSVSASVAVGDLSINPNSKANANPTLRMPSSAKPGGSQGKPSRQTSVSMDSTVRVGDFKIRETGLSMNTDENSYRLSGNSASRRQRYAANGPGTGTVQGPNFVSLGGSFNFVEINALGHGAFGAVVEALHIPTLTIVALKMLPCYNQQKRASIESELAVLCKFSYYNHIVATTDLSILYCIYAPPPLSTYIDKNMAELKLVDDVLVETDQYMSPAALSKKKTKVCCPYVLGLYDAFNDPKTGLINLVIEYMDGGSLADVVTAGGLPDEEALADISAQVLQGLMYLHSLEQMHRDIKPGKDMCIHNMGNMEMMCSVCGV